MTVPSGVVRIPFFSAIVALLHVSAAITVTSIILTFGIGVSILGKMNDFSYFGILIGMSIFVALIADYFTCPALIMTLKPFGEEFDVEDDTEEDSAETTIGELVADQG